MSLQPITSNMAALMPSIAAKVADKIHVKPNDFSFWDLLDVVNPLQHIPVVSNIYRQITGDNINGFARIAGGALFGGVLGVASGVANTLYAQKHHGHDFGDMALAKLQGREPEIKNDTDKPLEVVVKAVPPAERFPDVINKADIIWDTAPLPAKKPQNISHTKPQTKPQAMPAKLTLADIQTQNPVAEQTDITQAMALALAKYDKMKNLAVQ